MDVRQDGIWYQSDAPYAKAGVALVAPRHFVYKMNKTAYLGELENMILLAILRLGDEAYGLSIREELERSAGRTVSRSAAYITLERLVAKGYATARMGHPSPRRGGKAKRYFSLTAEGKAALKTVGRALRNLWDGHESLLDQA